MKGVRVELERQGHTVFVDVVCDCSNNGLMDEKSGEASFKHKVEIGIAPDKILACRCGKKYRIHPQGTHIHVSNA